MTELENFESKGRERRRNKVRIVVAVILAETLPILVLVAVIFVYSFFRQPDSLTPDEFAPRAGMWVGPIGGFLAVFLFAWWVALAFRVKRSRTPLLSVWGPLCSISVWAFFSAEETPFNRSSLSRTPGESLPAYSVAGWQLRRSGKRPQWGNGHDLE